MVRRVLRRKVLRRVLRREMVLRVLRVQVRVRRRVRQVRVRVRVWLWLRVRLRVRLQVRLRVRQVRLWAWLCVWLRVGLRRAWLRGGVRIGVGSTASCRSLPRRSVPRRSVPGGSRLRRRSRHSLHLRLRRRSSLRFAKLPLQLCYPRAVRSLRGSRRSSRRRGRRGQGGWRWCGRAGKHVLGLARESSAVWTARVRSQSAAGGKCGRRATIEP
mmetsp:Transcript_42299/g.137299  ORF Transcript_42299/g.137299 Transcript_42299/m.137299 type:complete len:214 (-) Transcript_42299:113-754(-)